MAQAPDTSQADGGLMVRVQTKRPRPFNTSLAGSSQPSSPAYPEAGPDPMPAGLRA